MGSNVEDHKKSCGVCRHSQLGSPYNKNVVLCYNENSTHNHYAMDKWEVCKLFEYPENIALTAERDALRNERDALKRLIENIWREIERGDPIGGEERFMQVMELYNMVRPVILNYKQVEAILKDDKK